CRVGPLKGDDIMRTPRIGRVSAAIGVWLLVSVFHPPAARAATEWHAIVGAQSHDMGHQALAFLPTELWIHQGDSVKWDFNVPEIHTVTFLSPGPPPQTRPFFGDGCPGFHVGTATFDGVHCLTTPPLVTGDSFTVFFTAAGNFKMVCLVHENMTG